MLKAPSTAETAVLTIPRIDFCVFRHENWICFPTDIFPDDYTTCSFPTTTCVVSRRLFTTISQPVSRQQSRFISRPFLSHPKTMHYHPIPPTYCRPVFPYIRVPENRYRPRGSLLIFTAVLGCRYERAGVSIVRYFAVY